VSHLVLLAGWAADAEEGVGALELLDGVLLDHLAGLADGVALADDVVAGVEPGEGEVAVGAAPELASVGLHVALALPNCGCISTIAFTSVSTFNSLARKQVF
jgi:hypothetical protein